MYVKQKGFTQGHWVAKAWYLNVLPNLRSNGTQGIVLLSRSKAGEVL